MADIILAGDQLEAYCRKCGRSIARIDPPRKGGFMNASLDAEQVVKCSVCGELHTVQCQHGAKLKEIVFT